MTMNAEEVAIVDRVIRSRATKKFLADEPLSSDIDRETISDIIDLANVGPVHLTASKTHRKDEDDSILPWRFYVLESMDCRSLRDLLLSQGDQTKIPNMLAAACALIQVTWLPDPPESGREGLLYDPTIENMEHIAAGSAAIQNMLIGATARSVRSYWSSGGALRSEAVFSWLDIPKDEILLGSVFLFPRDETLCKVAPGKLRDKRGDTSQFVKWVNFY